MCFLGHAETSCSSSFRLSVLFLSRRSARAQKELLCGDDSKNLVFDEGPFKVVHVTIPSSDLSLALWQRTAATLDYPPESSLEEVIPQIPCRNALCAVQEDSEPLMNVKLQRDSNPVVTQKPGQKLWPADECASVLKIPKVRAMKSS